MDSLILPYNANEIAATHSAITGLIAGFALTGMFLLVERVGSSEQKISEQYLRAMLLLFIASLVATLAAFLYSSIVGIPADRAYFNFVMAGSMFAISSIVLLLGITFVFSVLAVEEILVMARRISYFVILFSALRVWDDLSVASTTYGLPPGLPLLLLLIFLVPYLSGTFVLLGRVQSVLQRFQHESFKAYGYTTVAICFGIAFWISLLNIRPESQRSFSIWQPLILMALIAIVGTWTILLSPQHSIEREIEQK